MAMKTSFADVHKRSSWLRWTDEGIKALVTHLQGNFLADSTFIHGQALIFGADGEDSQVEDMSPSRGTGRPMKIKVTVTLCSLSIHHAAHFCHLRKVADFSLHTLDMY